MTGDEMQVAQDCYLPAAHPYCLVPWGGHTGPPLLMLVAGCRLPAAYPELLSIQTERSSPFI